MNTARIIVSIAKQYRDKETVGAFIGAMRQCYCCKIVASVTFIVEHDLNKEIPDKYLCTDCYKAVEEYRKENKTKKQP